MASEQQYFRAIKAGDVSIEGRESNGFTADVMGNLTAYAGVNSNCALLTNDQNIEFTVGNDNNETYTGKTTNPNKIITSNPPPLPLKAILMGDSLSPSIKANSKKLEPLTAEGVLWEKGKALNTLSKFVNKYPVDNDVTHVFISIGTNDRYGEVVSISKFIQLLKTKFPNAANSIYIIKGLYGYAGLVDGGTDYNNKTIPNIKERISNYYKKWADLGVNVLTNEVGQVTKHPGPNYPDSMKLIGKEIDDILSTYKGSPPSVVTTKVSPSAVVTIIPTVNASQPVTQSTNQPVVSDLTNVEVTLSSPAPSITGDLEFLPEDSDEIFSQSSNTAVTTIIVETYDYDPVSNDMVKTGNTVRVTTAERRGVENRGIETGDGRRSSGGGGGGGTGTNDFTGGSYTYKSITIPIDNGTLPFRDDMDPKNIKAAFDYFVSIGFTKEQAAGACGGLLGESSLKTNAFQRSRSGALGIGQWLGNRLVAFLKHMGLDGDYSEYGRVGKVRRAKIYDGGLKDDARLNNLQKQLEFIGIELNGDEKGAANFIKKATSPAEAAIYWSAKFERPGGNLDYFNNIQRWANNVFNTYGK